MRTPIGWRCTNKHPEMQFDDNNVYTGTELQICGYTTLVPVVHKKRKRHWLVLECARCRKQYTLEQISRRMEAGYLKYSKENGWFAKPKKLGEPVIIIGGGEFNNEIGFKQAARIDDGMVLVYFPRTRTTGHLKEFKWEAQAVRYTGTQILNKDKKNVLEVQHGEGNDSCGKTDSARA